MEYPTEDPVPVTRAAPAGVTDAEVAEAQAKLDALRSSLNFRIRTALNDDSYKCSSLPSIEALREERVRLTETVRHHKDEQDSLALDIEGHDGAAEVYNVAARVQRFERFAQRSNDYVEGPLRSEMSQVEEADKRQSEEEIAAYIQELQNKRETLIAKLSKAQEKKNAPRAVADDAVEVDEETKKSLEHAAMNVHSAQTLSEKIKTFRALKTKLSDSLALEKRQEEKNAASRCAHLKNAQLTNARDVRQVKELNSKNAVLITTTQLLLSQLNSLHYGIDNAPTAQQMIEERKRREATPEPTPANYARGESGTSVGSHQSRASRPQSLSKPPLVAMKRTESQRNRDCAIRNEREETSVARRRASEAGAASAQSSRRQSLSKPPLVASKPTASQRSRDEATRSEREEQQPGSQQRSRSMSISSDARPPSVAAKSTESQRNREAAVAY